jgi:transcriptional regulator GlxA family with amidase domain
MEAPMQQIGFVIAPGFQVMGFAVMTVFEMANLLAGEPVYDISLLSERGGPVRASAGFDVETRPFDDTVYDTVIVGTGTGIPQATPGVLDFVRLSLRTARRVAAHCTAAFILGEAGALDGRRATTHWHLARELQARVPTARVEEDRIFIIDGPIWTSAGMSAGIDLALAMVEKDLGGEIAHAVARKLVVYHRRSGGQSQFSTLLELEPKSDRIQKALTYASKNLRNRLSVDELADAAGLSPRQFSRAFRTETGQSPAKAVEHLRVEAARLLMEQGRHSMDTIASETGFADRERMRRAFLRNLGQPPQTIRRNARVAA